MSDLAREIAVRIVPYISTGMQIVDSADRMRERERVEQIIREHTAAFVRAILGSDQIDTEVGRYVSDPKHAAEYLAAERQERDEHTVFLQAERDWLRLVAAAYATEAINVTGNLDPKAAVVFVRDHETPLETQIDERGILVRTDALEAALRAAIWRERCLRKS